MKRWLLALAAAALAATPVEAAWREASSRHFVVYSEQDEADLRDFATRLERYDSAMRYIRNVPDEDLGPSNRLIVFVVPSIGRVQKLAGDKARSIAGFYLPRAGESIAVIPRRAGSGSKYDIDEETLLLHEYAHHFLFQNYSSMAYPAWFSEGFAEFHSAARFEKDGRVGIGLPALHRARSLSGPVSLPAKVLLSPQANQLTGIARDLLYARGWLLTHMLTLEPKRKGQLSNYLELLNSGKPALEAASAAFGDLDKLDADLDAYRKRRTLSYMNIPAESIRPAPVAIRTLPPAEAAMMPIRIQSDRGVNREMALKLLPQARRAAAPFPTDPAAQGVLAEAEYDAGNYVEAEAAADRALAADPKSVQALIYKGMAKMALARAARSTDRAVWTEVRRWFLAANLVEPNHPVPLILFYRSFGAAGVRPTANAVDGLRQAFALAPHDRGLRLNVARQYLADGKGKEARAALAPIAFDPHAGALGKLAATIVARLDAGGGDAVADAAKQLSSRPGAVD